MDYEKKYKDALKRAKKWALTHKLCIEDVFPELAESEDERIRRAIWLVLVATEEYQDAFYRTHNITRKECTDWLEKQKEQKPTEWSEEEKGILFECISALQNSSNWLLADKLKSLRPQPHWKPSEEQMEYLAKAIETLGYEGYCKTAMYLSEIRKELKKL